MIITKEILKKIAPGAKDSVVTELEKYLDEYLAKYNINTWLRVCHFLAQAAHESAGFKTLEEYASGSAYEGRKDLGNVNPGDGKRFKGRGIFQLTGRANYKSFGEKVGVDLISNPELAQQGKISVLTACEYWNNRKLSTFADKDDVLSITKKINGGTNGLEDRKHYLAVAKKIVPQDLFPHIYSLGEKSENVKTIQKLLFNKGFDIVPDGDFGPKTKAIVEMFQEQHGLGPTGTVDRITLDMLKR